MNDRIQQSKSIKKGSRFTFVKEFYCLFDLYEKCVCRMNSSSELLCIDWQFYGKFHNSFEVNIKLTSMRKSTYIRCLVFVNLTESG